MKNHYDKTIGYSPLEDVDEKKMLQVIKVNKRIIDDHYPSQPGDRILVAGAGNGLEAVLIAGEWKLPTFGVDLNINRIELARVDAQIVLQCQNITRLAFINDVFSIIYCYHVLEHVEDPAEVIEELQRVLKPGGVLFIGFPNKNRLFSYVGSSQKVSLFEKVRWNFQDYLHRLKGRFENRLGAHAGFADREFLLIATPIFSSVKLVRRDYMMYKYERYEGLMKTLARLGLGEFLFPSNYYICAK